MSGLTRSQKAVLQAIGQAVTDGSPLCSPDRLVSDLGGTHSTQGVCATASSLVRRGLVERRLIFGRVHYRLAEPGRLYLIGAKK
jgi:hypothetical protein